jgi:hypothetical protein
LGKFWRDLPRLENVDTFYGHLQYFTDIWDILWPFGTFCVQLVHFSGFGIMYQVKYGNPASIPISFVLALRPLYSLVFCTWRLHECMRFYRHDEFERRRTFCSNKHCSKLYLAKITFLHLCNQQDNDHSSKRG